MVKGRSPSRVTSSVCSGSVISTDTVTSWVGPVGVATIVYRMTRPFGAVGLSHVRVREEEVEEERATDPTPLGAEGGRRREWHGLGKCIGGHGTKAICGSRLLSHTVFYIHTVGVYCTYYISYCHHNSFTSIHVTLVY